MYLTQNINIIELKGYINLFLRFKNQKIYNKDKFQFYF